MKQQVILANGLAVTGMITHKAGRGMRFLGTVPLKKASLVRFTRNIIDNPALERELREKYGFGDLPEVQSNLPDDERYKAYINRRDIVYSLVDQDRKKIHQGKLSGEVLPEDLEIQVFMFRGD